jgi:GT2 family glycosyltransferase
MPFKVPPEISVIVLNYNGQPWLGACLDALAAQAGAPSFETIVVDNASIDGSAAFVAERYPSVRLLQADTNLGFAAGNHVGARAAAGSFLAFLNNDTIAAPDWLARLHASLATGAPYGLATSRIVFMENPDIVDSAGDGYFRAGGAFKRGHGARAREYAASGEVFGACGAAFLIRRAVYEALGGFDESFFMVYEDVDLSYRARLLGHRCWYAADAVVRHAVSATLGRASRTAVFYGQRNLEWTWIKNTPWPLLWRTAPAHFLYSVAGVLHYARLGLLGPAMRGKLAAARGLPAVLRARRGIQSDRVADPSRAMDGAWLLAKRLEKRRVSG